MKTIRKFHDCNAYHQWWRSSRYFPESGLLVRGLFRDGRELICDCSPDDGVWFINMFVCDPPIWWSYIF